MKPIIVSRLRLSLASRLRNHWGLLQKQLELSEKLKSANQSCSSAEAGLKTTERQAKEQRQKLYSIEIDLAM